MGENFLNKNYAPMWKDPLNYRFFTVNGIFGGPELNRSQNEKRRKSIENAIDSVKSKYENSFNDLLKQRNNQKKIENSKFYKIKSLDQWKNEKDFYKKTFGKDLDIVYPNDKMDNWKKIIKFWTNLFLNILSESKEKDKETSKEEQTLLLIMSSKEFAEILTSSNNKYSIFSRSVFLNNQKKLSETSLVEKLNNNEKLIGQIQTDFIAALENVFKNSSELINNILKSNGINKIGKGYSHDQIKRILKDKDDISFKRELKKFFETISKEIIQKTGINITELKISKKGEENTPYLILNLSDENFLNQGTYQKLLEGNKNFQNKNGNIDYREIFYQASVDAIKRMDGLKEIDLGFIKQQIHWKKFFSETNNWKEILLKKIEKINLGKVNLNSGLKGLLGEFLRVSFKPFFITEAKQTGNVNDRIKIGENNISLGESFSDAYYKVEEKDNLQKIGLNIKHYVSRMGKSTITIYNEQKGITFMNNYIYKYFDKDIVSLLRFIDVNYALIGKLLNIKENALKNQYDNLAQINLTKFIRATTTADVNYFNYFFVINNQYIPTSYIYYLISQRLNNPDTDFFNIEIKSKVKNYDENESKNNRQNIIEQSLILSRNIKASTKITFNGLKIDMLYPDKKY